MNNNMTVLLDVLHVIVYLAKVASALQGLTPYAAGG